MLASLNIHLLTLLSPSSYILSLATMVQYPTRSDLYYPDVPDTTMPQGGSQWGSARPDSSQPAVNADSDDRHRAQHWQQQCAPTNHTTTTTCTLRDPYPAQAQGHCYAYPLQPYTSMGNYMQCPYDFAEYPVSRVALDDQDRVFTDPSSGSCSPRWTPSFLCNQFPGSSL